MPMDIEWALADGAFAIVQARPITALPEEPAAPEPELQSPTEWPLPKPKGQYMRGSIVDLMPDPLSPLFATLAIPAIARVGIKEVMRPLTRSEPALPEDYIVTINDYAYMGVAYTPRQWWWILTRMLLSFPRLLREGLPLWRDEIRPRYAETVARWQDRPLAPMSSAELWAAIQEMNDTAMLHLASLLVAYIPLTHMSHFFTKWFMYHDIRWNDEPNFVGGKIERQITKALQYPVSWSAPHIRGDGKKNWADVATSGMGEN